MRDETKYTRMLAFGSALPHIRAAVEAHLRRPGLDRDKLLATVVRLLDSTALRVGNTEYARANGSFGLTTLRTRHAAVSGSTVRFQFRGKGGKLHQVDVSDARVARVIRRGRDLPGQELFQYADPGGRTRTIVSDDVNAYLRRLTGDDFTAKDFRTWAGTVLATVSLHAAGAAAGRRERVRSVSRAVTQVAERLGNTPAICRKSYIRPAVIEAHLDGAVAAAMAGGRHRGPRAGGRALRPEERCVLGLLERRVTASAARAA